MKRKVINAKFRKESQTFHGWLKYEIEIQNEDGTTEIVPAYGKDLQDALSGLAHDELALKLEEQVKHIPNTVWVLLWFGYILGWTILTYEVSSDEFEGVFFMSGIGLITVVTLLTKAWFKRRSIKK